MPQLKHKDQTPRKEPSPPVPPSPDTHKEKKDDGKHRKP